MHEVESERLPERFVFAVGSVDHGRFVTVLERARVLLVRCVALQVRVEEVPELLARRKDRDPVREEVSDSVWTVEA